MKLKISEEQNAVVSLIWLLACPYLALVALLQFHSLIELLPTPITFVVKMAVWLALWGAILAWFVEPHRIAWGKDRNLEHREGTLYSILTGPTSSGITSIPLKDKIEISKMLIVTSGKSVLLFLASIVGWFVIPIALLFTKREENKLPWKFDKWYGTKYGLDGNLWFENVLIDGVETPKLLPPPINPTVAQKEIMQRLASRLFAGTEFRTFSFRLKWLLHSRCANLRELLGVKPDPLSESYQIWRIPKPNTANGASDTLIIKTKVAVQVLRPKVIRKKDNLTATFNFGNAVCPDELKLNTIPRWQDDQLEYKIPLVDRSITLSKLA